MEATMIRPLAITLSLFAAASLGAQAQTSRDKEVSSPGNGVTWSVPTHQLSPEYTQAAKDAGIEGFVRLSAVVDPDGHVDRIVVTRSLDKKFGLDDAAVEAAGAWTFRPCTK